ncbi:serine/threonine-protein kinase [Limibaculum sp. FT325]|uniref:serine/threonine-protein kinase n=1 Tax=Thermohalobaculum sediminis TaxID=2939436 RepID=UPI0020BDE7A4|nr:serine/threonine-protein kinase [Limibaculum sediminis]MCL5777320.1 serine/threonine-protein kinase [Limibaculum sediminis]
MTNPKKGMLAPGVVLNYTYEIVDLVGEGGTGEVYLARNKATGREVAIKLLKREFAADPTLVELMQREANALHEIMHPAVVRYYELLRTEMEGGITFLVMEFIRGESLGERLRRGPVPPEEILQIARRVIDGLEVAHGHKVLHRDLTPANVILRDGDPAKATLIDFGIAKDLAQTKHSVIGGGFAGTYQYASPEQIDGRPLDPRSDFYSLGATLLAACEGRSAGEGKTLEQIIGGKTRTPETEHLPGVLRPLIQALLQPNPDDRPRTAADVRLLIDGMGQVDDLDALIGGAGAGEKTVIRPAGRPAPAAQTTSGGSPARGGAEAAPPAKKKGGAFALIAGIAVVAGLGAGGYFLLPGLMEEPLPVASPYQLDLKVEDGTASVAGNAPSEEEAVALRSGLSQALDGKSVDGTLTPATGMPTQDWTAAVTELAAAAKLLENWSLSVADTNVVLRGTAPDRVVYSLVEEQSAAVANARALSLDLQVALAPQPLAHAAMNAAVAGFTKCGPLRFQGPDPLPPGTPVLVSGPVASQADADAIRGALGDLDGARAIEADLTITSELVCKVERLLPRGNAPQLSFAFSYGQKEGAPTAGYFVSGDNPVIDVRVDQSYADAYLYVFYVDGNTGKVIHLLPYKDRPENRVDKAGTRDGDHYAVRVLFPAKDVAVGRRGFLVGPPYGTNIFVAVASPRAFLDQMLPRNDAAELFLEDLVASLSRAETTEYIVSREFFTTREN